MPVPDIELEHAQRARPVWVEDEGLAAGLDAGEATLEQVYGAGHRGKVNTLRGGPAIHFGDIGRQRLDKVLKACARRLRASTQACTTELRVDPCEVRAR